MKKKLLTFFKKILPWFVAVGIFAYLFDKYPPANLWNSLKSINISYFCLVAALYFLIIYFADTFSFSRVLSHFGHKESVRELLPARGLTYLIMVVNYAAAQAAFAFYQNRKHQISLARMFGIFGITVVVDLLIMAMLAAFTTFFTSWPFDIFGVNIGTFVRIFALAGIAGILINIAIWRSVIGKMDFFEKLRKKDFFTIISNAGIVDYLSVMLYRLPVHIFIMIGMYFAVKPFNANIPFINIISNIPIIFFIGSLPISPGGLGATNMATVELFKPFISSPNISSGAITAGDLLFSFSLLWMFANYFFKALTGAICLKFVSKDLFKPTDGAKNKAGIPDITHLADDL